MNKVFEIYDAIAKSIPKGKRIVHTTAGGSWSLAETEEGSVGIAMTTSGDTRSPIFTNGITGMDAAEAATAIRSWNLSEASFALAAANACLNTEARMKELGCKEDYDAYCTRSLEISGKKIGVVGHLKMPEDIQDAAAEYHILEFRPQPGDYPASACEWILPGCDIVLITGSSIINKTLPRLLELCRDAYVILTGPSVPMCPDLLELGIDRLAGFVATDAEGLKERLATGVPGPPYDYGQTFLLTR